MKKNTSDNLNLEPINKKMIRITLRILLVVFMLISIDSFAQHKRVRDYGIEIGVLKTGKNNAITDIEGVRVGHTTLIIGDSIRTGVTAILPLDIFVGSD